jgi:hypothetical protein
MSAVFRVEEETAKSAGTRGFMNAHPEGRHGSVCRADNEALVRLYGLSIAALPRALAQAYADPLLTPQPEPPRPPVWQALGVRIRLSR